MFVKILIGIVAALAVFAVIVSMQPEDFTLTRSTTINATPAEVFANVNDFHKWENWSPWAKLDPEMKSNYEGPTSGEGAAYSWAGSGKVGEGKMRIVKSDPNALVQVRLDFIKPMNCTNMADFTFKPEGQATTVTWTMTGKNNFIAKAIHLVFSIEKMVGPDFEKGLAQLKAVSESKK